MTTIDITDNTKSAIFGALILFGVIMFLLTGHTTSEVGSFLNSIFIVAGAIGLFTTDKVTLNKEVDTGTTTNEETKTE